MSLQVYFDNVLIDEQYYTGLTNNNELFNESFKLGATACNQYKLKVAKDGVSIQPTTISLRDDGTEFARLTVDNIEEQDYEYVYTLTDKMVDLNFKYDASEIFINGSTTLYNIALDICTKAGLVLGTTNFRGYDKYINWYDNTRTAREYIGFIAELNGGFARIENNTLYFKKQNESSVKTIDIDDCEDFNIGEYHKITRVVYELGALKYEFGNEDGNTLYLNADNVYITEESEVEAIYNEIKDFEFYSFSTKNCPIDYDVKTGDIITFTDGTNNYPTIAQFDLEYFGGWIGGYKLDINTEKQEETKLIGDKDNIRNLKIIVDRQNNTISQVVEEVGEQNTKISQTQQTVNELNSKIQDIADITTQAETIYASLSFTDINQSEPIEVKIHPTTTNISYLYPRTGTYALYPSDTQYMPDRILRFTNTDTNEVFDYELPEDLLYNSLTGTYDEFYLGYDEQICQVVKRCTRNAQNIISDLTTEVINTYTYPSIPLTDGDYTVELVGYNNGYMSVRLMSQNIYTTQFATKAELSSTVSQTASEIYLAVDEKLDEEDFTSANIMLKINNDESLAQINADKINLNGVVTANEKFKINTDGSMEAVGGTFTEGQIKITGGTQNDPKFLIADSNETNIVKMYPGTIFVDGDNNSTVVLHDNNNGSSQVLLYADSIGGGITMGGNVLNDILMRAGSNTHISCIGYMEATAYNYLSDKKLKENIKEYNFNAINLIKNGKIYTYNLKRNNKKEFGFVVGENYKCPKEIVEKNEDLFSINAYRVSAVLWKAIQEQQEQIEQLQQEVNKLKGEK